MTDSTTTESTATDEPTLESTGRGYRLAAANASRTIP